MPDLSQLFLLYNGQLVLGLFAGAALSIALRPPRPAVTRGGPVLALAAVPPLVGLARALPAAARRDAAAVPWTHVSELRRLRRTASPGCGPTPSRDAVVFADNPSLVLSAMGEVRLFYENGLYTARAAQPAPRATPWPERHGAAGAAAPPARRRGGRTGPARGRGGGEAARAADSVQSRIEGGYVFASGKVPPRRFFPEPLFERVFANDAMQVYVARPAGAPSGR